MLTDVYGPLSWTVCSPTGRDGHTLHRPSGEHAERVDEREDGATDREPGERDDLTVREGPSVVAWYRRHTGYLVRKYHKPGSVFSLREKRPLVDAVSPEPPADLAGEGRRVVNVPDDELERLAPPARDADVAQTDEVLDDGRALSYARSTANPAIVTMSVVLTRLPPCVASSP